MVIAAVLEQLLPINRRRAEAVLRTSPPRTVFVVRMQMPADMPTSAVRQRMPTADPMRGLLGGEPRPDGWVDVECGHLDAALLVFNALRRAWPEHRMVLATEERPCVR